MRRNIIWLALALSATGCNSAQLRFTAMRQMETEPDIYNQQVLDNLAKISLDPASLPYFNTLDSGIPQIVDKGTIGGFFMFPAQTLVKQLHQQRGGQLGPFTGERDVQGNWTLKPVNDDTRLTAMRGLYLWVLQKPMADRTEFEKTLKKFIPFHPKDAPKTGVSLFTLDLVPSGWFRCGHHHDVPEDARYVLHKHGTYFWVAPGMENELTKLTTTMLRIALTAKQTKSVVRYYYNKEGRLIQQETSTEGIEPIVKPGVLYVDGVPKNEKKPGTPPSSASTLDTPFETDEERLDTSPDPDLKIDTMSNPEISPGLITLPH